ncbi:MAG: hypothetical protein JWO30_489 [Fibrobacteres bacterium]|nr:hypothetical protein [Fibrobacterota bacterium]
MIGFGGRSPVAKKKFVHAGALLGALVYGLLSLNLSDLKPVSAAHAHPEAVAADSSATGPIARVEAIAAPGSSAAGGEGGKCCCRHTAGKCEMGCCGARAEVVPNESCYHACEGTNAPGSVAPFRMANHLATLAIRFSPRQAIDAASRPPVQAPHSFPSMPPEKIPIA